MSKDGAGGPILEVRDITTRYHIRRSGAQKATTLVAVENVTLSIKPGQTLGLVGESGCGKSTLGRTILRLLEPSAGSLSFSGQEITHFNHQQMRPLRQQMQIVSRILTLPSTLVFACNRSSSSLSLSMAYLEK